MASASDSLTFCIPLNDVDPGKIAGDFDVGNGFSYSEQYIGDAENIGLKYLTEPHRLMPTDWPLVLFGPSGTGKTAIALSIVGDLVRESSLRLIALTAIDFSRRFAHAVETNTTDQFRHFIVNSSALFVDDLDNLRNHSAAQDELSLMIDFLTERQVPMVFTASDRWIITDELTSQLYSRLTAGLCLDVQPPGLDARRKIISLTAQQFGLAISDAACDYLSLILSVTFPGIRSFFARLKTWLESIGKIDGCCIDRQLISDFFEFDKTGSTSGNKTSKKSIDLIVRVVGKAFRIKVAEIKSNSRKKSTVLARAVAIYFLRHQLGMSFTAIGKIFGGRDHSTIMHSLKRIEVAIADNNSEFISTFRRVEQIIIENVLLGSNDYY